MDMKPGSQILCADGSIVMEVISTDPKAGTVRVKCLNNATLGCAHTLLASPILPPHLADTVTHMKISPRLCHDGARTLQRQYHNSRSELSCQPDLGTLRYRERKNVNLPGVVVDLPTLTKKDEDDLVNWGLPNDIDFIAASFVRKGLDLDNIRKVCCIRACSCQPFVLPSVLWAQGCACQAARPQG